MEIVAELTYSRTQMLVAAAAFRNSMFIRSLTYMFMHRGIEPHSLMPVPGIHQPLQRPSQLSRIVQRTLRARWSGI